MSIPVTSRAALSICAAATLLSGCALPAQPPLGATSGAMSSVIVRSGLSSKVPSGWAPADLQSAYNLPSATKGKGQIVAIVEAYDNPRVAKDLAKYRATFKLSKAIFTKYNQEGQTSNYPAGDESWGIQIDLDVEMVSASCPNCTIYLVEANSSAWSDLEAAQAEAVTLGAHIVSNSFNGGGADESFWDTRGVTYVASSADAGGGLEEPASFEHVVAVGGTTLSRGGGGSRGWTESIWIQNGGCVSGQKPAWQRDKYAKFCHGRLGNDVSAIANNVAEYDSYGLGGWTIVTGTQVGAPFLAGVFGLAGNAENQNGGRTFWLTSHHQYLYQVEKNGKYVKYSEGGGWGSPNGTGAF